MNFQSCIKVPAMKSNNSSEILDCNDESLNTPYYELVEIAHQVFGHGKWSHSVTNQTIDFLEYVMGRYLIGCSAFVKVQLDNGTYHEVMGYANAESSVKSSAVFSARITSITNALRKALICFGGLIEEKVRKISINHVLYKKRKLSDNQVEKTEQLVKRSKSPDTSVSSETIRCVSTDSLTKKDTNEQKTVNNSKLNSAASTNLIIKNSDTILPLIPPGMTEEEARQERKRRQKEKQEEFRRQMLKEKELKVENKPNSKF